MEHLVFIAIIFIVQVIRVAFFRLPVLLALKQYTLMVVTKILADLIRMFICWI